MRTYRLVVAYDGTGFHGWQVQRDRRTVQGTLEAALREVLQEQELQIAGAGRTDAGVHARGQVASFRSATRLPASALAPLLNRRLPDDVRVREAAEAPPEFHARHTAVARRYAYRLLAEDDLLLARIAWWPGRPVDPDRLERATRALEGEADCSAFRNSGGGPSRPVCRIHRAGWSRSGPFLRFDIVGDHFLYQMVRNVVGTALAVAAADDPAAAMRAVLASRERRRAGVAAPPQGLCLEEVFYREVPA